MKILFEKEGDSYFAIAQKQVYNGKVYDELLWAELQPQPDGQVKVTWEDDYFNPSFYPDMVAAKSAVIAEHGSHKPFVNGRSYDVE